MCAFPVGARTVLGCWANECHLRRVGILTARLQQHGQTMSMLYGFDRRRADEVTELGHSRGESLSPTVISATRDLVDDLHPGGSAVVVAVLSTGPTNPRSPRLWT